MEVYKKIADKGEQKCKQLLIRQFLSSILSGCFIGFGACCSIRVGGEIQQSDLGYQRLISGLFGLPIGLLLIVLCDTQLFTGNTAFYTISLVERKVNIIRVLISHAIVYIGNLIGSILFAMAIYGAEVLDSESSIISLAESKISHNLLSTILKGTLCNWFVCLALWQAACGESTTDKAVGIFLPIAGFVALGLEHSVANMYIIPQAFILNANITITDSIIYNLVPVTVGNMIAGIFLVGFSLALLYHNPENHTCENNTSTNFRREISLTPVEYV